MAVKTESVNFIGALGEKLAARVDRMPGPVRGYALFAHCFTCSKDLAAARRIASGLAERGIAVLRFDFTGLGHSDGEFANTTFASNVDDLVAAADWMRQRLQAPCVLVGHSLGGAAVIAAAHRIPEIKGVATIGAPADPAHVTHNLGAGIDKVLREGEAEVTIAGRSFRVRREFIDDLNQHDQEERIRTLKRDLLIFHAPLDQTVGIDNATTIFRAAKHPKSFVSLDKADHLLSRAADAAYVASVLAGWAERFLPSAAGDGLKTEDGTVMVADAGEGLFPQTVLMGPHRARADEPERVGGTDTGGTPYDFLAAALGACTNMTIKMYASRKGWQLDDLRCEVRHDKVHAEDCANCETTSGGKVDRFRRILTIRGPLDTEQRAKLLEIADKCPVHRTLHSEVAIETELAGDG